MFLIFPISFLVVSLALIFYISARKFSHLRKLSIDHAVGVEDGAKNYKEFVTAMVPEVAGYFKNINVEGHKISILVEFEKFLRKTRVWFLKIDNVVNNWIRSIRASAQDKQEGAERVENIPTRRLVKYHINQEDELRKEEQRLILEIAKSPKEPDLYKTLGDIYMKLEQFGDAQESFASAIKLDPEIKGVKTKLDLLSKIMQGSASEV